MQHEFYTSGAFWHEFYNLEEFFHTAKFFMVCIIFFQRYKIPHAGMNIMLLTFHKIDPRRPVSNTNSNLFLSSIACRYILRSVSEEWPYYLSLLMHSKTSNILEKSWKPHQYYKNRSSWYLYYFSLLKCLLEKLDQICDLKVYIYTSEFYTYTLMNQMWFGNLHSPFSRKCESSSSV